MTALLSRMVNLRELQVNVIGKVQRAEDLLTAVMSASRHWPLLERLQLTWYRRELSGELLCQLRANCARLTSVTLNGGFNDDDQKTVLTELLALRKLNVSSNQLLARLYRSCRPTCTTCGVQPLSPFLVASSDQLVALP